MTAIKVVSKQNWGIREVGPSDNKPMAELRSVSSPRRVLSLSKKRRATIFISDTDDKTSGFGLSGENVPKNSEVYGFLGSITTVVATAIFLIWAYVPEHWLHSIGITYYPNRYWALAVPAFILMTVLLTLVFYVGLNFMATPPPKSLHTVFDEYSREPMSLNVPLIEGDEQPIDPIFDIDINQINRLMFNGTT